MYFCSLATIVYCTRQSAFLLNQSNMKINSGLLADLMALVLVRPRREQHIALAVLYCTLVQYQRYVNKAVTLAGVEILTRITSFFVSHFVNNGSQKEAYQHHGQ